MENGYKSTIRLPNTSFPMKANLNKLEDKIQSKWKNENIYVTLRKKNKGKTSFILHDGPPYANGNIHLGTALNKILKDILCKGRSLLGYDAPLVVGWDCHGLPIEWKVEENFKKAGKNKNEISKVEFRLECRKFAEHWLNVQREEFKKLGLVADFNKPYITMDYRSEALIYKEITKFIMNDSLYLGKKPVMWSVIEKTALAEAEVEYIDKISDAIFVGFKVVEASQEKWKNALAVIWTTTPWTIPANQAIAYNPNICYGLYEVIKVNDGSLLKEGDKIIIAKELAEKLCANFLISEYKLVDEMQGLPNFQVEHPMFNAGFEKVVPLLEADYVDIEVGSGLVHTAPAYGLDDFFLGKKHNINPVDVINDEGIYNKDIPVFAGMHIFKVAESVIETLKNCSSLVKADKIKHSYPCSWRSKAPLIYRLTEQWFLSLEFKNLRQNALNAINKTNFFPKIARNRLYSMVENRPDWCLSRQRLWGVPIAMFVHKETEKPLKDQEVYNNIYNEFLKEGSDAWFIGDPKRFLTSKYNKDDYTVVFDVIDVWFDSGCSHVYVLRDREELRAPADIYLEGSDQHRGWFQSSLLEGVASFNEAPYKSIVTHGFVLDAKGQKMSKSLGNVINPLKVIESYGLDILRLWVTNSDYKEDIRAGDSIFKQQADSYRKIRNTLRYMLGNLTYLKDEFKVSYEELPELEKLVLHYVYNLHQSFKKCFLETYEFHNFFNELYNFISIDLSAFYFDVRKDTLYCDGNFDIKFKGCLTVIDIVFDYVIKWLSPFISITAEEAFLERHPNKESILLQELSNTPDKWHNKELLEKYEFIKQVRKEAYSVMEIARSNKVIGSSLEVEPIIYVSKDKLNMLNNVDLASICITSGVCLKEHNSNTIKVEFNKKVGSKCQRCWKIEELNNNSLCNRCERVLNG